MTTRCKHFPCKQNKKKRLNDFHILPTNIHNVQKADQIAEKCLFRKYSLDKQEKKKLNDSHVSPTDGSKC